MLYGIQKEGKNVTGFVLLCVNIAHYQICKKNLHKLKAYKTKILCPYSWHWNKGFEVAYHVEQVLVLVDRTYSMVDLVMCFV